LKLSLIFGFLVLIMDMNMCRFFKVCDVSFRQFLDESWTDISSPHLAMNKILYTI